MDCDATTLGEHMFERWISLRRVGATNAGRDHYVRWGGTSTWAHTARHTFFAATP